MTRILSVIVLALTVSACQTGPHQVEEVVIDFPVSSLDELASLSVEARHELRLVAKAQEALAQEQMTPGQHEERFRQAVHVPPGFEERVDFHYRGPASEAAEAIAVAAGYEILFFGKRPVNEPFVRIELSNRPLNEGLRELGIQTGDTIRVEVYSAAKLMRIIYKP